MCETYSRWLLRVSVAQICQALGWDSVQVSACDLLTDVLQRYLQGLGRGCHRYCELYGRTDPVLDDVGDAFKLMGVNLHELEDYIHNIEPVTFAHQIPSFPVSKNNVLQFPQPGSKDAEERKEYIPDYMPPIVSSQEEEEEEQVPTDGGTSAEAMQVPLEEEGDMEEDEAINDENYLSKRPLESPDAEEFPPVKRLKPSISKGDTLDGALEPQPPMLAPIAKSQVPTPKTLETKPFVPKTKSKTSSPGQKTKSPKTAPSPVPETPSRTPLAALSDKIGKENIQVKQGQTPPEPTAKPNIENQTKKAPVMDKTIDDSIDAVIAQVTTPKPSVSANNTNKAGATPIPPSGGTSSSDISWTMDDSIDEVIRKANMGTPSNPPANFTYFSSPSASPPTPEPLIKVYEEKTKLASSAEVKKKLKKELKTKMKKKEKQKEKDKEKNKEKNKEKEKSKEKDKDKEGNKEAKFQWKELLKEEDLDPYKFKLKDFEDADTKIKVEPVVPAPSPVIPRLTLRVGAGQDKIVISKVVPAPEAKPSTPVSRPKTPPPVPSPVPAPIHVTPPSAPAPPPPQATVSQVLIPPPSPAVSAAAGSKAPVRSVVTETVSTYVIRDESGNQIWICPGCNKPDDGSPMIGCDDCDDWYHWPCVGITTAPPEEVQWFCSKCANKKKDKKHKKRKHRAH
ncbi:transcription initiation factor TFIID subunit 3 [Patagioenas fasciata monilis]|uniref:Transcription initiation factor TFIID subunit 3 n=1 Tax=Patagioenas fasciata monilis TaxID=372326 RepID=A0A1V4JZ32_PATFA|nr:transcription initiation factor TFIID subunit 3 [Patagioenas fasciata monilis]